jgi:hypothetical protein
MATDTGITFKSIEDHIGEIFPDLHAKRIVSLANATLGVVSSKSLAVTAIGKGLAHSRGLLDKHAIKQVDRLLSNKGIDPKEAFTYWVPYCVGVRKRIEVAMDWTDHDADNQATIMLSLLTSHGRSTSLVWLTVDKDTLKHHRNEYEYQVLVWLAEALPADVRVLIVADRGFGDQKLYAVLTDELKFDYLIRFRGNIKVTAEDGETRTAADWVGKGGRARILRGAAVTADEYRVGAVISVHAKGMKEPWCLATSRNDETTKILLDKYAKRWGIECSFRDDKDPRFGMGMGQIRLSSPARRDRLWLLSALATALMTLLGAAGEALGFDKHLKTNTTKRRVHSLFTQGCRYYELMPTMQESRLRPLIEKFGQVILEQSVGLHPSTETEKLETGWPGRDCAGR